MEGRQSKYVTLPPPFDVIHCISDPRRKGKRVLAHLSNAFVFSVYMAPSGLAIEAPSADDMSSGIVWMQCTNAKKFNSGYICVGRYNNTRPRPKKFANIEEGLVDGCFLCIPQQFYFDREGDLAVAYHMLDNDKLRRTTLAHLMSLYAEDGDNFVRRTFTNNISTIKAKDITLIYLQQVLGPSLEQWNVKVPIYTDKDNNDITTIEMCDNPNSWIGRYIKTNCKLVNGLYAGNLHGTPFGMQNTKYRDGQCMLHKLNAAQISKSNNPILKIGGRLLERAKSKADDFVCSPRPNLIGSYHNPENIEKWWVPPTVPLDQYCHLPKTKNYSASFALEYVLGIDSSVVKVAELHAGQYNYVKEVEKDYSCECMSSSCRKHLHKDNYNKMLDNLLSSVGREPIILLRQTINDNVTETATISLSSTELRDNNGREVSSNISKLTMDDTLKGDFGSSPGLTVQHIFSSPFVNSLSVELMKVMHAASWGTDRDSTDILGTYQNIGVRSSGQGTASMGAHSKTKHLHDYWSWDADSTLMPLLMKIRNILRKQSSIALQSCGSVISLALRRAADCDLCDMHMACLFTCGRFANTRHLDARDFLNKEDSAKVVNLLRNLRDPDIDRYLEKLEAFHSLEKLPVETCCFWTLLQPNGDYDLMNGFVNFTAGTMLDLSSRAFEFTEVIGSVFLGSLFEHCTTHPIWIRKSDNTVRFTPPSETPYNSPTAWGTHETTRKEKAAAARAAKEAIRARDKRAKKRAKHNSTR